jgi:hypothetical protein
MKQSPPPLIVTIPPFLRGAEKNASASTGAAVKSVASRKGRPCGSRKQSPVFQSQRVRNAVDRQPALARNHSIAFDAFMSAELDGQASSDIEATGDVAAQFQQGEHI